MNLAVKDIRHNLPRFLLTAAGVGLLMLGTMGMSGLYRGIVDDAMGVIDRIGADLWVVQAGTEAPFAEASTVPISLVDRVRAVPGVAGARAFLMTQKRFKVGARYVRGSILGLDFTEDRGAWMPLVEGRLFASSRGEAIADRAIGLRLGDSITLGTTALRIVGLTRGFVDSSGNPLFVCSLNDALDINRYRPPESVILGRAQVAGAGVGTRAIATDDPSPGLGPGGIVEIGAVMVRLRPDADPAQVRRLLLAPGDVSVLSRRQQREVFLLGRLDRLRTQILFFVGLLTVISAVVVTLTVYMLTVEKLHDIALLKLIGARNRVVAGLILQQALLIGLIAYGFALLVGHELFPLFPRAVVLTPGDYALFGALTLVICTFGSLLGIRKALRVRAQEVLA